MRGGGRQEREEVAGGRSWKHKGVPLKQQFP